MKTIRYLFTVATLILSLPYVGKGQDTPVCDELIASFSTKTSLGLATRLSERVELRRCHTEGMMGGPLQLTAWKRGLRRPSLVVDTAHYGISTLVMSGDVFAVETFGGTANQVFVVVFTKGVPKLAVRSSTKGVVRFSTSPTRIRAVIENQDRPSEEYEFLTDSGDLSDSPGK